jgi:hypothetical protein
MNQSATSNQLSKDGNGKARNAQLNSMARASTQFSTHTPRFESHGSKSPFSLESSQVTSRKSPAIIGMSKDLTCFSIPQNGKGNSGVTSYAGSKETAQAESKSKKAVLNQKYPTSQGKGVPPPPSSSPFGMSPPWMKRTQPSRRKIAPSGALTALERYLPRMSSIEPHDQIKISSTMSDSQSVDDGHNYNTEDLESMADFSESYLDDDFTESSSLATDYVREGVIAIGVMAPTPANASQSPTKESQQDQEIVSEVVAKDLAEQEHNLKIKRRESSILEERRLSVPAFSRAASDEAAKGRAQFSLTDNVEGRPSFMENLKDASCMKLEEPALTTMVSAPIRMIPDDDSENASRPFSTTITPRLRARKSGGLNSMMSSSDRQEKARAAMGALGSSTSALHCPPPSTHRLRSSPASMVTKRAPLTMPDEVGENSNSEDSIGSDCTPPSLHSTASTDSGLDLDEKTRNEIIRQSSSHAVVRRLSNLSDDIAKKCTSLASTQSMHSTSSSAKKHPSEEFTIGDRHHEIENASMPPTLLARRTSGRPSDEKQHARISVLTGAPRSSQTVRRQCDEKVDFRRGGTSSHPGAHAVRNIPRDDKNTALRLASGDFRQPLESENDLSFGPVTTSDVNQYDSEPDEDLEAQAGVPVLLPGAFAVSSRDQIPNAAAGYDSGFEEESAASTQDLEETAIGSQQEDTPPILRPDVPDTPVQAELYEEHLVDGLVLLAEDEGSGLKDTQRFPCLKAALAIMLALLAVAVSLAVLKSGKEPELISDLPGTPALEGWSQLGEVLMGPTNIDNARFGFSISMSGDGNRLAIGLPGADGHGNEQALSGSGSLHIYDFNGTNWLKSYEIAGPGMHAGAGKSIALSYDGRRVAFAAPLWGEVGFIAVYEEAAKGNWTVVGEVPMSKPDDQERFGGSLDLSADGRILAVSDKDADSSDAKDTGKVRVFKELNKIWTLMGSEIEGGSKDDFLGWSISLSGDGQRLAVSTLGVNAGGVILFQFDGGSWEPVASELRGESRRENFGSAIALSTDGTTLAIGATGYSPNDGREVGAGRVRIFRLDDEAERDSWVELGDPLEGSSRFDAFGTSVALSETGDVVAIGGPENDNFGENSGQVKLFKFDGLKWAQLGSEVGTPMTEGGQFGFALAMSADAGKFAGASPFANFDGFVNDVGQVWVFDGESSE